LLYSRIPLVRKLVIRTNNYPDRFGLSGKFVGKSKKLTCLEITGCRIKLCTVIWLLELLEHQTRCGRTVWKQIHTVSSNSPRNSNCQYSLFSNKNSVIRIFCLSGQLSVPINPDKYSSTVMSKHRYLFCTFCAS
jgi:hypothetical protein